MQKLHIQTRRNKDRSNSDKKLVGKKSKKGIKFFSSVLSESTPRETQLSPQASKVSQKIFDGSFENSNYGRPRKNSQIVSMTTEGRVYTPDQLHQMYDESI